MSEVILRSHQQLTLWKHLNSFVLRWVRKVFNDGAEHVLSEMLFNADVAQAVKARPPIVARRTLGMTRSVVDDDCNLWWPLSCDTGTLPGTLPKWGMQMPSHGGSDTQSPLADRWFFQARATNEDCRAVVWHGRNAGGQRSVLQQHLTQMGACQVAS